MIGQVLEGRYRVESRLGEGGMGVVYLATHVALGRKLALKVLRSDMARDVGVVQRFMQEARAASSIGHPNIVDIHDFGRLPDGSVYFAMEYLDGESLSALIERKGPFSFEEALRTVQPIASALGAAHALGIVHRDLKPDNVFLARRPDGQTTVKVLDFGVAKVGGAASKMTRTGVVFGTPHYMSPEQAGGQSVDARTDIYALGVIMYEMVTGQVPFDADTFMGILTRHMFEPPPRPTALESGGATSVLEPVVMRCLAKRPEDRFQSMDELLQALEVLRAGGTVEYEAKPSPAESDVQPAPTRSTTIYQLPRDRAPLLIAIGVGVLLLSAVAVVGVSAFRAERSRPEASLELPPSAPPIRPPPEVEKPVENEGLPTGIDPDALVVVDSQPSGAEVVSDGAVIGNTPFRVVRPAQGEERALLLRFSGYESAPLALTSESPSEIRVALARRVATPSRAPTKVRSVPRSPENASAPEPERVRVPALSPSNLDVVDPWAR